MRTPTSEDVESWRKGRPYVEAVVALILYIRWGDKRPGTPQERMKKSFEESSEFLNIFEDRNQIK